jgi:hypothetical protein
MMDVGATDIGLFSKPGEIYGHETLTSSGSSKVVIVLLWVSQVQGCLETWKIVYCSKQCANKTEGLVR